MKRGETALSELTSQEYRRFILPTALMGALTFLMLLINVWIDNIVPVSEKRTITILVLSSTIYVTTYGFFSDPDTQI